MLVMRNILFVVYCYLFVTFSFFIRKNNYLLVLLNYLFPGSEINYLVLKICLRFYHKNIIVQSNLIWMLGLIVLVFF